MPEQLGIERHQHDGIEVLRAKIVNLPATRLQEMLRVRVRCVDGPASVVELFLRAAAAGDAVIFDSGKPRRLAAGPNVVWREIEPNVAVEIPVSRIAGITS